MTEASGVSGGQGDLPEVPVCDLWCPSPSQLDILSRAGVAVGTREGGDGGSEEEEEEAVGRKRKKRECERQKEGEK